MWSPFRRPSLQTQVDNLQKEVKLMASQADLDALTARLVALDTRDKNAVVAIQAEITALQSANPSLDLTGLTNAVGTLEGDTTSVEGLEGESPAPSGP
jgi:hypothetical protein